MISGRWLLTLCPEPRQPHPSNCIHVSRGLRPSVNIKCGPQAQGSSFRRLNVTLLHFKTEDFSLVKTLIWQSFWNHVQIRRNAGLKLTFQMTWSLNWRKQLSSVIIFSYNKLWIIYMHFVRTCTTKNKRKSVSTITWNSFQVKMKHACTHARTHIHTNQLQIWLNLMKMGTKSDFFLHIDESGSLN